MAVKTAAQLSRKKCVPCEGGVAAVPQDQAQAQLEKLPGWKLSPDGKKIGKSWRAKDFTAGINFFKRIAKLANAEDHHPDLHLEGYRNVRIELSTHAIGGLSENDFILAAKIDTLPVKLKTEK